jgi:hypothetical protein
MSGEIILHVTNKTSLLLSADEALLVCQAIVEALRSIRQAALPSGLPQWTALTSSYLLACVDVRCRSLLLLLLLLLPSLSS